MVSWRMERGRGRGGGMEGSVAVVRCDRSKMERRRDGEEGEREENKGKQEGRLGK